MKIYYELEVSDKTSGNYYVQLHSMKTRNQNHVHEFTGDLMESH